MISDKGWTPEALQQVCHAGHAAIAHCGDCGMPVCGNRHCYDRLAGDLGVPVHWCCREHGRHGPWQEGPVA